MFMQLPSFPPFWVKLMGVAILLFITSIAYAGYRLYSHGVEVAETRNAAESAIRARQIVEKQGNNLVALRRDEKQAREDREAFRTERDTLKERIRVARETAQEMEKKHLATISDQKNRIDNLGKQQIDSLGEKQQEEIGTCNLDDIIILPQLPVYDSVDSTPMSSRLLSC